ncbi:MAG: response regulator transcription factor [Euzebya sp.]
MEADHFDVMLLDVTMPGLDGFAVLHRVRSENFADVPVVMLTAQGRESDVARPIDACIVTRNWNGPSCCCSWNTTSGTCPCRSDRKVCDFHNIPYT